MKIITEEEGGNAADKELNKIGSMLGTPKETTPDTSKIDEYEGLDDEKEEEVIPEPPETKGEISGYSIGNVSQQIDGIVEHWFKFASEVSPEKREKFLALGERLNELSKILKMEFLNAQK